MKSDIVPLEAAGLDQKRLPRHVAFIMDGNRRWAKERGWRVLLGHQRGSEQVIAILRAAKEYKIPVVTLFVFSTENWQRSDAEVQALLWLFERDIRAQTAQMVAEGMRFDTLGVISAFPLSLQEAIEQARSATRHCDQIQVRFAMNYGGRDELCRAVRQLMEKAKRGELAPEALTELDITALLDTHDLPDVDLVVRTGGEQRLSNFLLWQTHYAEWVVEPTYWPDFSPHHLLQILVAYQQRQRRWGK